MGHDVFATGVDVYESRRNYYPAGPDRRIRRVFVTLKTGPYISDIRERCSLPQGIVYGVSDDERAGPVGRFLQCTHCIHCLEWPLPERPEHRLEEEYSGDAAFRGFARVCRPAWRDCGFQEELLAAVGDDRELAVVIYHQLGKDALKWLDRRVPALGGAKPRNCLRASQTQKRLKECLLRMR
jgi:hypothetical protein